MDGLYKVCGIVHGISAEYQSGGATWFYGTLFGVLILYAVLDYVLLSIEQIPIRRIVRVGVAIVSSLIGFVCMIKGYSFKGLSRVFTVYPLIEIGRIFKEDNIASGLTKMKMQVVGLISIALLGIGYQFGNISLVENQIVNPIFFLSMSVAGWFLMCNIAKLMLMSNHLKSFFELLSKQSIWIIGCHFLAFKVVTVIEIVIAGVDWIYLSAFPVFLHGFVWNIFYTIAGLGIPLLMQEGYACILNKVRTVTIKE